MEWHDPNELPAAADAASARAVLAPALQLWLVTMGLWGAFWLASVYVASDEVRAIGYVANLLATAIVIFAFVRRDRVACRVFARPPRGMAELCVLAGIVGAMGLAMWERTIPSWGSTSTAVFERELGWPVIVALLTVAALPAVFEELAFRGVVLQRLRAVFAAPMAIAVQAMLFSLMHVDAVYLLPHFVFGCLAGFLRTAARALWPCILMHFLWNAVIVLATYEML